jgi:CRISPR system Cascade subunit CasE
MFISRVRLAATPSAGSLFRLLAGRLDAYESHRLVWALFGDDPDRQRDFLYRFDQNGDRPEMMIVSATEPQDPHHLFEIDSKSYGPALGAGDRLTFMARLNPIRRKLVDGKERKVDVVMDEIHRRRAAGDIRVDRLEAAAAAMPGWLSAQGERRGFAIDSDAVLVEGYDVHRFRTRGRQDATVAGVDLRGCLTVTDPDAFTRTLFQGLGAGRGFGFGLMLVRRG